MKLLLLIELTIASQLMMTPLTGFDDDQPRKGVARSRPAAVVTYRVIGLMKTKSGAT